MRQSYSIIKTSINIFGKHVSILYFDFFLLCDYVHCENFDGLIGLYLTVNQLAYHMELIQQVLQVMVRFSIGFQLIVNVKLMEPVLSFKIKAFCVGISSYFFPLLFSIVFLSSIISPVSCHYFSWIHGPYRQCCHAAMLCL